MSIRRASTAVLLILAGLAGVPAPAEPPPGDAAIGVYVPPATLTPGGRTEVTVTLSIAPKWRLVAADARQPAQAAILSFNASEGVYVEPLVWPAGTPWRAFPEDPEVKVYEDSVKLTLVVHAGPKTAPQDLELKGRLRYQAVRGHFFLGAATKAVTLPVTVQPAPAKKTEPKAPATRR